MVIGLMILTAIPAVTGISQAIHAQKEHKQREKDARRMQKFYIDIHCESQSSRAREIHDNRLILRGDRVWIGPHEALNPHKDGYVAEAFYIEYPDNEVSDPRQKIQEDLETDTITSESSCTPRPC